MAAMRESGKVMDLPKSNDKKMKLMMMMVGVMMMNLLKRLLRNGERSFPMQPKASPSRMTWRNLQRSG